MAQYRPFAIWDGESTIPSGVAQNQNILIGETDQEYYNLGGFDWWAGPDESLGYVIAYYDQTFTHPNPLNIPCGIGFLRSAELTDASFLSKANQLRKGLSLSDILNPNDAKTWLLANGYWTSYGEAVWNYGNSVTNPSQPSSPSSGVGEWFFYSTSGTLDVGPPVDAGNFIITQGVGGSNLETYDPNFDGSTQSMIHLNINDSANNSFLTEFNNLAQNGGTVSLTQNGQTATYSSPQPGVFFTNNNLFLSFPTNIQTTSTEGPFTYGDPISVSIVGVGSTWYWTPGTPNQQGEFAISANNTSNLELVTNILISTFAKDVDGITITDVSSLFAGLSIGNTIILKPASQQASEVTYVISSIQSTTGFGPNTYNIGVSHVSGTGSLYQTLWEIDFQ